MHGNARTQRLVEEKGLQLGEGPGMECCALRPSSPHPRANMGQIFDRNRSLCAFGLRNNPFGDHMIDVGSEPIFLTRQPSQPAAASERAFLLQLLSQPPLARAHVLDGFATMDVSITVSGNVRYAQIDAQHAVNVNRFRLVNVTGCKQIPGATNEGQITFARSFHQQRPLPFATDERDRLTPVQCLDRHRRVGQGKRKNPIIVGKCGGWAKRALCLCIESVGIANFRQRANNDLRAQAERFAHVLIAPLLKRKLAECATLPSHLADEVARGICPFKRLYQGIRLLRRGKELQLYGKFHDVCVP